MFLSFPFRIVSAPSGSVGDMSPYPFNWPSLLPCFCPLPSSLRVPRLRARPEALRSPLDSSLQPVCAEQFCLSNHFLLCSCQGAVQVPEPSALRLPSPRILKTIQVISYSAKNSFPTGRSASLEHPRLRVVPCDLCRFFSTSASEHLCPSTSAIDLDEPVAFRLRIAP